VKAGREKVAIVGTTAWGTTLGIMVARRGVEVALWARSEEESRKLNKEGENAARLPGFAFPPGLRATGSLEEAAGGAGLLILAVPSPSMRANARVVKGHVGEGMVVLSVAKGIELDSTKRMSEVIAEELGPALGSRLAILSGPNLSQEIARGLPAATVVAAADDAVAQQMQAILMSPLFRVYTSTDVIGVELGGALKNIIALACGMSDGLGYGDNAKAALMGRGLVEITRLGVALGAQPLTFAGLAGLGDLVATCSSPLSRNRFVGQELARGRALPEITSTMMGTAEGINTTVAARQLAGRLGGGVELPITAQVHRVLFEGLDVRQAVSELMGRGPKAELADLGPSGGDGPDAGRN